MRKNVVILSQREFEELVSQATEKWTYESFVQYQATWGKGPTEKTQIWTTFTGSQFIMTQRFNGNVTYEYYP